MKRHVTALFADVEGAARAVRGLEQAGFARDRISVLARQVQRDGLRDLGAREPTPAAGRAAAVGVIGGIAGGLVGLAAVGLPGGVVVAGPLLASLGGAAAGATAGGIVGAFASLGIPADEQRRYRSQLEQGNVLVGAAVADADGESIAERVLRGARPSLGPHVAGAVSPV